MCTPKGCIGKVIAPCGIHWLCRCQCLQRWRWLSQVSTAGSGRPWSSGSQSLPLPHDHQMWGPGPGGHKGGLLMCWCRTGRTLSCRTPGWLHSTGKSWVSEWYTYIQICFIYSIRCSFLKLTWIRLLPQSATMIFPLASTATPVGALNWPFPSPWEPNLNRNSPSALYTCRKE